MLFYSSTVPRVTRTPPFSPVEGSGVIIVVIILCLLLLASLGSVLYFLHKKGKIPCGRSGKQEITKEKPTKDDIVVEMKNNPKNEDAVLLKAVNGEKKGPHDQVTVVISISEQRLAGVHVFILTSRRTGDLHSKLLSRSFTICKYA
ncbi:hypothetical protein XENOCAPTIV_023053 [Xenoophorus captivus]|uniref:Uncharacterized protein n=1 Tax=Xenoophorus captivus TaxID=1517983 RepID=A0ABV0RUT3_9TELE